MRTYKNKGGTQVSSCTNREMMRDRKRGRQLGSVDALVLASYASQIEAGCQAITYAIKLNGRVKEKPQNKDCKMTLVNSKLQHPQQLTLYILANICKNAYETVIMHAK